MRKIFCDCCGKEITIPKKFGWLCHLTDMVQGKLPGYVEIEADGEMNSTSCREDCVELCTRCYNEIVVPSVKKYFELKGKIYE